MDELRKISGSSTEMALYVDELRKIPGFSTKTVQYLDQYHKFRLLPQKSIGSLGIQKKLLMPCSGSDLEVKIPMVCRQKEAKM